MWTAGLWTVVLATTALVVIAVLLHYRIFVTLTGLMTRIGLGRNGRFLALIFSILALHIIEIWLFGLAYFFLSGTEAYGHLAGDGELVLFDFIYYSATVYTTLGFGDITPIGPIRIMTGTEAITGLVLITWSASFTFFEMERFWRDRD